MKNHIFKSTGIQQALNIISDYILADSRINIDNNIVRQHQTVAGLKDKKEVITLDISRDLPEKTLKSNFNGLSINSEAIVVFIINLNTYNIRIIEKDTGMYLDDPQSCTTFGGKIQFPLLNGKVTFFIEDNNLISKIKFKKVY